MGTTAISGQATMYVQTTITAPYNPTSASVSFAFLGPYNNQPQASEAVVTSGTTFNVGSWVNTTSPYTAQCLVGPTGGVTTLATGTYGVWVKIATSPETPVLYATTIVVS